MLYGIRRGECAGIKLSAVDLRGKTITICSCVIDSAKIRAGDTLSSVIFGDGNK